MNPIIVAIPVSTDNAPLAEKLLDFCFWQNNRQSRGHCLLAFDQGVHSEMRSKCLISAKLAFKTVAEIEIPRLTTYSKVAQINHAFRTVANHVQHTFRCGWLLMEPDCVPLKASWLDDLTEMYNEQPCRYAGSYLFIEAGKPGLMMARVGIYPPGAGSDLERHCEGETPFELSAAAETIPRCHKTKLIQQLQIAGKDTMEKVRPDAVLLHSDKTGALMEKLRVEIIRPTEAVTMLGTPPKDAVIPILHRREVEPVLVSPDRAPAMIPAQDRMAHVRAARGKKKQPLQTA